MESETSVHENAKPYNEDGLNIIYELLFCDKIALHRSATHSTEYPWNLLLQKSQPIDILRKISLDDAMEARLRLLAFGELKTQGIPAGVKQLLGVVIEVGLEDGLDVLAAFEDGSARYINHSGKLILWESKTVESAKLVEELFIRSKAVIQKIGPWSKERRPFPGKGIARLSFLVSDGLYFGEAPLEVFEADPLAGPVLAAGVQLMSFLINQPLGHSSN